MSEIVSPDQDRRPFRLVVVVSHPIQYLAPFYRYLARDKRFILHVLYCHDYGVKVQPSAWGIDNFAWDIPLLDGYSYEFLKNISPWSGATFLSSINPSVVSSLRQDTDALLTYGYANPTYLMALISAKRRGITTIMRSDSYLLEALPKWKRLFKKLLVPRLLSLFDAYLCVGKAHKAYLLEYGVRSNDIYDVAHSVDGERWTESANVLYDKKLELRQKHGFSRDSLVVLFCGVFERRKRLADLLDAAQIAQNNNANVEVCIVGGGKEETVNRLELRSNVKYVGYRSQLELPEFYALSDVIVLPSDRETWGLVVNEAMYFGNAVVVSDRVGCGPDLVEDKGTGYVFPVGDVEALASILIRLDKDRASLSLMQSNAKDLIQRTSFGSVADAIIRAIEESKLRSVATRRRLRTIE